MIGITTWGAYVPRLRLKRSVVAEAHAWLAPTLKGKSAGHRSMCNWDEDSLTMAVEAARDALGPADDRSHIKTLYYASSTAPFVDRLNASIVAGALTLEPSVRALDITGSQRAGLSTLAEALLAAQAGQDSPTLIAAAEHRRAAAASTQEMDWGDAGVAFVVGSSAVAAEFLGHAALTVDFVDHFRAADQAFDYQWEDRWIRDEGFTKLVGRTLTDLLANAGIAPGDVTRLCLPSIYSGLGGQIAKSLGIKSEAVQDTLALQMGEAGAVHGLVILAHALEQAGPGEIIVAAQFGQGCEAIALRTTDAIASAKPGRGVTGSLADAKEETNYMKFLVFNGLLEWDKGMRAEKDSKTALSTLYRNSDAILGLVGGRCRETGVVQFPRSRISVAPNSFSVDTQEPYKFAERKARVLSWSADNLTYTLSPPNHYGMVVFDGGGRILMDITDVDPGDVDTGDPVVMSFRVKDVDERRGFRRYFWKAVPDRAAARANQPLAAE